MTTAVILCGALLCVAGAADDLLGLSGRPSGLLAHGVVATAVMLVVVAGLVADATSPTRTSRLAAVTVTVAVVPVAVAVVSALRGGVPGPSTGLLAVGVVAVLGGSAGAALGGDARSTTAAVLAAVLTVGAGTTAGVVVEDLPVRSSTARAATAPTATVTSPGAQRWRWAAGGPVRDVAVTSRGVAVLAPTSGGDAVVGLDGASGQERWRYRRAGAPIASWATSPDGSSVVLTHSLPDASGGARGEASRVLLTVLDGATGTVRATTTIPDPRRVEAPTHLTDRVVTVLDPLRGSSADTSRTERDEPPHAVSARALDDGRERWRWVPPAGCALTRSVSPVLLDEPGRLLATRDVVVAWADCGRDRVLYGLDDHTGAIRWTSAPFPITDADGTVVAREPDLVALPDARTVLVEGSPPQVLDVATGATRPVPGLPQFDLVLPRPGPVRALRMSGPDDAVGAQRRPDAWLDATTGALVGLPREEPGECSTPQGAVVVPVAGGPVVRLCGVGAGFGVRRDEGPVTPVDLGAPALVPPGDPDEESVTRRRSPFVLLPAPGAFVVATTSTDPAVLVGFGAP